jgi:glycosyltransferase involved in cell wall biosynthesis
MKTFDYLACGRAIAASDIPVFHEVLSEKSVLFCEPENPQDWIAKVDLLTRDETLRRRLGSQARRTPLNTTGNTAPNHAEKTAKPITIKIKSY